jgi:hypothetical protein
VRLAPFVVSGCGGVALVMAGVPGGGSPGCALLSSLRRGKAGRHDGVRSAWSAGSIRGSTTPRCVGVLTWTTPRRPVQGETAGSCRRPRGRVRVLVQGADVVVAQRVEDVLELTASGRDDADVVAAARSFTARWAVPTEVPCSVASCFTGAMARPGRYLPTRTLALRSTAMRS